MVAPIDAGLKIRGYSMKEAAPDLGPRQQTTLLQYIQWEIDELRRNHNRIWVDIYTPPRPLPPPPPCPPIPEPEPKPKSMPTPQGEAGLNPQFIGLLLVISVSVFVLGILLQCAWHFGAMILRCFHPGVRNAISNAFYFACGYFLMLICICIGLELGRTINEVCNSIRLMISWCLEHI